MASVLLSGRCSVKVGQKQLQATRNGVYMSGLREERKLRAESSNKREKGWRKW
jgi:hypothetical protein